MAKLQPDYKVIEKTHIAGLNPEMEKGLLYYFGYFREAPTKAEEQSNNYKYYQSLLDKIDAMDTKIAKLGEKAGKPTPTSKKLFDEMQGIYKDIKKIPIDFDLKEAEYQGYKRNKELYNLFYDIANDKGKRECKAFRDLASSIYVSPQTLFTGDMTIIKSTINTFTLLYAEETTAPLTDRAKALFFDYLRQNILLEILTQWLALMLRENNIVKTAKITDLKLVTLDTLQELAQKEIATQPQELKDLLADILKDVERKKQQIGDLKNPYKTVTMPVRPTGARLPILEYKEGVKTPTDKIVLTTLYDNAKEITGTIGGLNYTITHLGKPLNKTNLFNLLIIGNCYLHRNTENQAINRDTPLIIPFSEIARAKNAGDLSKMHPKDIEKFNANVRELVTRRVKIKISYPDNRSKKGQNLFSFYNHLEPDETYLLQANFKKDPTTGERYLAITDRPSIFEILRKNGWVEKVPLAFFGTPLKKALNTANLYEDTQATAFLLFSYLITRDRMIGHKYKKIPKTFNIDYAKLYEVVGATKRVYNENTGKYEEIKMDYSELSKADKQNFRRGIIKFLSAFSTIAQEQKDQNYYSQYPFLSILPQDKALYSPAYNATTQKAEGLSLTITDTYSKLLKAKNKPQK